MTHPLWSKEVVVQRSESLPGVVTPVSPAHEVFYDQSNVDEADAVVRGQISLENHKNVNRQQQKPPEEGRQEG